MKTALAGLLGSKKFLTAITGIVVAIAAKKGFDLDSELVAAILGVFAILVGAQGAADFGKEAAKVEQQP
jgi:hypothetical protein